jgi:ferric-dicitrate binding protein FerR (iron transport regulator)
MARQEARRQLEQAEEAFDTLRSLLTSAGPQLAEQLGLVEPPRRRRFLPVAGLAAVVVIAAVVGSDPRQRQKLQRLIVH